MRQVPRGPCPSREYFRRYEAAFRANHRETLRTGTNGFGWDDCCNTDLPLGRIFSALWLLNYSADDYWNEDWNGNALHWACSYVRVQVNELWAKFGDGSFIAYTFGDRIELYLGCFYKKDVPGRAETLVHESRHRGGKPHDAKFPKGSTFGEGKDGAD